jgi:hypothetical protein
MNGRSGFMLYRLVTAGDVTEATRKASGDSERWMVLGSTRVTASGVAQTADHRSSTVLPFQPCRNRTLVA